MTAYYNEIDPQAAQWLRNLIAAGHIAPGEVDERSISDVAPGDLVGFTQCHFFAGIGLWSLALRRAGWDDGRHVWTGSCPCQPFSEASSSRKGAADDRHLWPEFRRLIAERRPAVVFGEQVASKDGRVWLAGVRADLEALGSAVGAADLCAAGVGSPQRRQRLYWVADANGERFQEWPEPDGGTVGAEQASRRPHAVRCGDSLGLGDTSSEQMGQPGQSWQHWDVVDCGDGKRRRFEPGSFPLAYGYPGRVVELRAYGNAIVPELAEQFIRAYDTVNEYARWPSED